MGGVLTDLQEAIEWTETSREWLIAKPLEAASYIVVALILRWVAHKLIDRATRRTGKTLIPAAVRKNTDNNTDDERRQARSSQRRETIASVFKSVVTLILVTWVILTILTIIGINVAPFIASAGVVGIALGWGAQSLVRDFLSGVFMLLEDQYGVGDVVDFGEAVGTVEHVGLRVTTLRALNGTVWYVRNGEVLRVGNHSQGYAVAVVDVALARPVNVTRATRITERSVSEAAQDEAMRNSVLEAPTMLGVDSTTAYTVTIRATVKVRAGSQWAVQRYLTQRILADLAEADIVTHDAGSTTESDPAGLPAAQSAPTETNK
ncbi:mechanosensitive ion channel family protein [Hoyosella sp. YIM 151337]|uniref:mechanosensitive ion channel family protein n=1 Tax=Hoyosella sp. YIM 151337 TaxID=2992742 RepID=UPI00223625DD|nr:mechanosensitive ion channel family protein [Hoyosella sp. YIM 151337]MCW4353482.1 mechanosensitive ion channel family protein [Hoyosella sp. YIM 151337]